MKIFQILPEMNVGGVELVTSELARYFIQLGHESVVISHGGSLVSELLATGSRHIALPVHRKHPASLLQVRKLRKLFENERPDILQIASRVPGWLTWLAWHGMDPRTRPRLVSTVHGFYSVNAYSAVMTRGERVTCVSESIRDYVLKNYPSTPPSRLSVIHGGVDAADYFPGYSPPTAWLKEWQAAQPQLLGKKILLMPGRLTRWKGQEHFIRLIAQLTGNGQPVHGLIAGVAHPRKLDFFEELKTLATDLGVSHAITFLGSRDDLCEVMAVSDIVYSLSLDPEAFGRVSLEAMALGKPVIAYNHGGVSEQLREIFPSGLVPVGDVCAAVEMTTHLLREPLVPGSVGSFSLDRMQQATLALYSELLASPR